MERLWLTFRNLSVSLVFVSCKLYCLHNAGMSTNKLRSQCVVMLSWGRTMGAEIAKVIKSWCVCSISFLPGIHFFLVLSNMRSDKEGGMKTHLWDWCYRMLPTLRPSLLTNRHEASAFDSRCISMWFVPWMHQGITVINWSVINRSSTVIAFWATLRCPVHMGAQLPFYFLFISKPGA